MKCRIVTKYGTTDISDGKFKSTTIDFVSFGDSITPSVHGRGRHTSDKQNPKRSVDLMIFWMCLGFATSFILGYIACLIRSL